MIRLKDIAAQANVSLMTVSKVLRDAPDISAATKARIRRLASEMGYTPHGLARGLRNRTSTLFGLVISSTTNPIFARVVMALEDQAHQLGYDLILAHSLDLPEREETVIRRFLARRVDGLFLSPVYRLDPTAAIYEELRRLKLPTVLLGHRAPFCQGFVSVETDDSSASATATRHLIGLGHRRIAFLSGPLAAPSSKEQLDGYRRALEEVGLAAEDEFIFRAGTTIEDGQNAALQLLQEQPRVTGVIASNDLVAIGASNVFLGQGLKIPKDLSVVGSGNILLSEHYRVPMTTIRQPKFRLGVAAMDSMTRLLRGENPGSKRLAAEILVRESTGPPREP